MPAPLHPICTSGWPLGLVVAAVALMATVRNQLIRRRLLFSTLLLTLAVALHLFIARRTPTTRWFAGLTGPAARAAAHCVRADQRCSSRCCSTPGTRTRSPTARRDRAGHDGASCSPSAPASSSSTSRASTSWRARRSSPRLPASRSRTRSATRLPASRFRSRSRSASATGSRSAATRAWSRKSPGARRRSGRRRAIWSSCPNGTIAKESINNYSEPTAPTRLQVDVGCAYEATPNDVRVALLAAREAVRPLAGARPAPTVVLMDFAASSVNYRLHFWVEDFSRRRKRA